MSRFSGRYRLKTERGPRYLGQLCKHFAHKVPSTFAEDRTRGHVEFPFGTCDAEADDRGLLLRVQAETREDLERTQQVVARHLAQFAYREEPTVVWVEGDEID